MQKMPEKELMEKEAAFAAEVERLLPDFVNSCGNKADVVTIHQDAFAADYQDHEYALLGKAIKFARRMSTTLRQVLTKFSEFSFFAKKFRPRIL